MTDDVLREAEACIQVLREREAYLRERVLAKQRVGWEFQYDERERSALAWVIDAVTRQK